ncbi:hypothetical protein K438DRAFT_1428543, partial [Mycena galopus ATCC 62051]
GKKPTPIAKDLQMPLRVVQRILTLWKAIRTDCRVRKGLERARLMSEAHCNFIIALLQRQPDLYLDEIQLQLIMMHNMHVSLPTLCRTLHRLGYTSKKV